MAPLISGDGAGGVVHCGRWWPLLTLSAIGSLILLYASLSQSGLRTDLLPPVAPGLAGLASPQTTSVLLIAGTAILLVAWLRGMAAATVPVGVSLAALLAFTPLLVALPLMSFDAYLFLSQGWLANAGFDVYSVPVGAAASPYSPMVSEVWKGATAVYPAGALGIARLASAIGASPFAGLLALRTVTVLALAGSVALLLRGRGLALEDRGRAIWALAANPAVLLLGVVDLHYEVVLGFGVHCAMSLARSRRPALASLGLGVSATVKPFSVLQLPFVGLSVLGPGGSVAGRLRSSVTFVLSFALGYCGLSFLLGAGLGVGGIRGALSGGLAQVTMSPSSLAAEALRRMGFGGLASPLQLTVLLVALGLGVAVAWRMRRLWFVASALVGVIVLLGMPTLRPWYFIYLVPVLAASSSRRIARRGVAVLTMGLLTASVVLQISSSYPLMVASVLAAVAPWLPIWRRMGARLRGPVRG